MTCLVSDGDAASCTLVSDGDDARNVVAAR
jgi:hypothetical protein